MVNFSSTSDHFLCHGVKVKQSKGRKVLEEKRFKCDFQIFHFGVGRKCQKTRKWQYWKYSYKRQFAGSNVFRPKPATLTLIPCSWWHRPPCSSKICVKHTHDKPQISPNWFFSYMLMAFIAPLIGWAQHALVGRLPIPLSTYPPDFVMIGQRMWELWPITSKPRPLQKYIGPWRPCFLTNLAHL